MALLKSSNYITLSNDTLDRVNLGAVANTIEGDNVSWVANATAGGGVTVTVLNYDKSRTSEFRDNKLKPHVIIKCACDCSANNYLVNDQAGNLLYTFNTDCSAIAKYLVLRLVNADRNTVSWELA